MNIQSSHTSEMELNDDKSQIRSQKKIKKNNAPMETNIDKTQIHRMIALQPVSVRSDKFRSGNFSAINRSVESKDKFAAVLTR